MNWNPADKKMRYFSLSVSLVTTIPARFFIYLRRTSPPTHSSGQRACHHLIRFGLIDSGRFTRLLRCSHTHAYVIFLLLVGCTRGLIRVGRESINIFYCVYSTSCVYNRFKFRNTVFQLPPDPHIASKLKMSMF